MGNSNPKSSKESTSITPETNTKSPKKDSSIYPSHKSPTEQDLNLQESPKNQPPIQIDQKNDEQPKIEVPKLNTCDCNSNILTPESLLELMDIFPVFDISKN